MEIEQRFYVCVIKQEMRLQLQVAFLIKESNGRKKGKTKVHMQIFFLRYIHCRRRGEVSLIKGSPDGASSYSAVYYITTDP